MRSVRPNGPIAASPPLGRRAWHVLLLAGVACSGATRERPASAADTAAGTGPATASAGASAPSAYVADIPAWPADTAASATDRDGRIPGALEASVPACRAETPIFAPDSVGPVFIGMPLANLFAACRNPLLLWHSSEGVYHPALALKIGTALLLLDASGTTANDVVTRIVGLRGVRTADGIGPGSTLAEVGRAYGEPTWTRDQCGVTAGFATHPWLAVHVDLAGVGGDVTCDRLREFASGSDFSHFPRGTKIASISTELSDED